jgi:putative transposase
MRLEPLILAAKSGGRLHKTDIRAATSAISSLSCAPAAPGGICRTARFPPRSTVYNIFRKFQREGIWEELHIALREALDRIAIPWAEGGPRRGNGHDSTY